MKDDQDEIDDGKGIEALWRSDTVGSFLSFAGRSSAQFVGGRVAHGIFGRM